MSGRSVELIENVSKTEIHCSIFEEPRMRQSYERQRQLDSPSIDQVQLSVDCRDRIVPVLRSLQHLYSNHEVTERIMGLIGRDINGETSAKHGREGMDYWQILVLA